MLRSAKLLVAVVCPVSCHAAGGEHTNAKSCMNRSETHPSSNTTSASQSVRKCQVHEETRDIIMRNNHPQIRLLLSVSNIVMPSSRRKNKCEISDMKTKRR